MNGANVERPWVKCNGVVVAARRAPSSPGVYAIGSVRRVRGLPISSEFVFVGHAAGAVGLKERLGQHVLLQERNPPLKRWLMTFPPHLEVWFSITETTLEAVQLEAELVRELAPRFNGPQRGVENAAPAAPERRAYGKEEQPI